MTMVTSLVNKVVTSLVNMIMMTYLVNELVTSLVSITIHYVMYVVITLTVTQFTISIPHHSSHNYAPEVAPLLLHCGDTCGHHKQVFPPNSPTR